MNMADELAMRNLTPAGKIEYKKYKQDHIVREVYSEERQSGICCESLDDFDLFCYNLIYNNKSLRKSTIMNFASGNICYVETL